MEDLFIWFMVTLVIKAKNSVYIGFHDFETGQNPVYCTLVNETW